MADEFAMFSADQHCLNSKTFLELSKFLKVKRIIDECVKEVNTIEIMSIFTSQFLTWPHDSVNQSIK